MTQSFSIIQETNDWLAVNKPDGIGMHTETGADGKVELGVVQLLKQQLNLDYLAPVHRLDKVTSGCLLLAKNPKSAACLANQFSARQVDKVYLAITQGKPKKKQGTIKGDMLPARNGNWKLAKSVDDPAITQFKSIGFKDGLRLAVVKIITGKTHQIRVALKSNGTPVWGDTRYGDKQINLVADRCYLHCWQLCFDDQEQRQFIKCWPEQGELFDGHLRSNMIRFI
ncbi:MAG: pseudouridine synthase [Kangiellaceae bacterium]|jgi:tRNA pseudouridine32 synthase/23S rRNA pseudouridine746 synthase|nr:pseudouridine synthase [Kangiellaceae bacterium]